MSYPEGDMAEPQEQLPPEWPKDPKMEQYTQGYLKRIEEAQDPEQKVQLAKELASEKLNLEDSSDRDLLTGLFNRRGFFREFDRALSRLRRRMLAGMEVEKQFVPGSILIIDLDRFKQANDERGHPFGDEILKNLGKILGELTRPDDVVCRYGGEEIVVALSDCKLDNAKGVAERIRKIIPTDLAESLNGFNQTVSIGVAQMGPITPNQLESPDVRGGLFFHAFKDADDALYFAKNSGRNRTAFKDLRNELGVLESDPNNPNRIIVRYQNPTYHPPK